MQKPHFMLSILLTSFLLLISSLPAASAEIDSLSTSALENRVLAINLELEQLAKFTMRSGVGAVGYRSLNYTTPHQSEWIRIDLQQAFRIDEIIIVPSIWRDAQKGFKADCFPQDFFITAGSNDDEVGSVIARISTDQARRADISPLIIPIPPMTASWVRINVTQLTPRSFDQRYTIELSEIMVFSGSQNVALHKSVQVSSPAKLPNLQRMPQFLVDGFLPYLMDGSSEETSIALFTPVAPNPAPALTIDLGAVQKVSGINLHTVERNDTIPSTHGEDLAIPLVLRIEGATLSDFSDAQLLYEDRHQSVYDMGPIIRRSFPTATCRYVKLTAVEPAKYTSLNPDRACIGFAEVELLHNGINLAQGKPTTANFELMNKTRSFTALTDGLNFYGEIIPLKTWMHQLARRSALEAELPQVMATLNTHYARQKTLMHILVWLVVILTFGIIITFLVDRIIRMRQIADIRERFSADLHDELGANVHAIGLLGNLAQKAADSPAELHETLDELCALTQRTGQSIRHCTNIQQDLQQGTMKKDMERTAHSILHGIEYTLSNDCPRELARLKPRTRADLYLFFKESLVNLSRHADATRCSIRIWAENEMIILSISDNGRGLSEGYFPPSLERRAHLLRSQLSTGTSEWGGTCITLKIQLKKLQFPFWSLS